MLRLIIIKILLIAPFLARGEETFGDQSPVIADNSGRVIINNNSSNSTNDLVNLVEYRFRKVSSRFSQFGIDVSQLEELHREHMFAIRDGNLATAYQIRTDIIRYLNEIYFRYQSILPGEWEDYIIEIPGKEMDSRGVIESNIPSSDIWKRPMLGGGIIDGYEVLKGLNNNKEFYGGYASEEMKFTIRLFAEDLIYVDSELVNRGLQEGVSKLHFPDPAFILKGGPAEGIPFNDSHIFMPLK